jgi:hypothetical protein
MAAPAMAGTMVFNIDVTSATGVAGFTPFSFQETFTLQPGTFSGFGPGGDYSGLATSDGTPQTAALLADAGLTGTPLTFSGYDLETFAALGSADFFQSLFVPAVGGYSQSIETDPGLFFLTQDEAGLAGMFAQAGAIPWYERATGPDFLTVAEYDGTATLVSPSALASGAPEPAGWALMILGFGGIGAALRRRARPSLA